MNAQNRETLTIPPDDRTDAEQPRWRQDFPIDWPQDDYISRRDFTKFMMLTSLAFTVGQFWILAQNYLRRKIGKLPVHQIAQVDDIPIGGTLVFDYPEKQTPRILVRLEEDLFVAYEQQCTHLACPLIPKPEEGRLHCPCHEGVFDLKTGQPLAGPPRRALARVTLEIRDGAIYATGLQEESI